MCNYIHVEYATILFNRTVSDVTRRDVPKTLNRGALSIVKPKAGNNARDLDIIVIYTQN